MTLPYGADRALERFQSEPEPIVEPDRIQPARPWPRWLFPLIMFSLTVVSTVWVGMLSWKSDALFEAIANGSAHMLRRCVLANWETGLQFSGSLLLILLAHEFGHYWMMRRYGIRSTFPIFIPYPISPFGTCGALILMDPSYADRKQIFDIGIAGPLAGLVVAIPLAIIGLWYPEGPVLVQADTLRIGQPLVLQMLDSAFGTQTLSGGEAIQVGSSSPILMAAWFGMLITGLNMVPISQLDGGHVTFGIFGPKSEWVAKATFASAVIYMIVAKMYLFTPMLILVYLMGLKHPPSSDDTQQIGATRTLIGLLSLSIPILCIPARPFYY